MAASDNDKSRLDDAARAGWLYFIAGHTQDEIARMLQISRASAQRLVSLCLAERLITFRLEHPIAACLADRLPQSPDRVAGWKHLGRRLGELLRYRRAAGRPNQGAALSNAAAVSDVVPGGARPDAQDRSDCQGEGGATKADLRLV